MFIQRPFVFHSLKYLLSLSSLFLPGGMLVAGGDGSIFSCGVF